MPADPKECRDLAIHCARLALSSRTAFAKEHFEALAQTFMRLAIEMERTQALVDTVAELTVDWPKR